MLDGAGVLFVLCDEPDIPFACEREGLALRQRLPLAALRGPYRRNTAFVFGRKLANQKLCLPR